ncbi:MAG: carbohydrate ABC transporter permease [Chloroflexota bacterium]
MSQAISPLPYGKRSSSLQALLRRAGLYLTVGAVCAVVFFPVYWMLLTSVRPTRFAIAFPPSFLPEEIGWQVYVTLFQTVPILNWLRNSAIVSFGTTLLTLAVCVLAAYAFSCLRFRGRSLFGFSLLTTQMLPEALLVIPVFVIFRQLNLLDSLQGLILVDTAHAVPIAVWVLKGYFDSIPTEILEAAEVDGCTRLGVLARIILPLSAPAIVTVGVIAFFDGWNEYMYASTFITTKDLFVTTVGLAGFIGELATPVEVVLAGATIFAIAPVLFYSLMQRYIVSGLTSGAVKG